jgi:hypothetical protein
MDTDTDGGRGHLSTYPCLSGQSLARFVRHSLTLARFLGVVSFSQPTGIYRHPRIDLVLCAIRYRPVK